MVQADSFEFGRTDMLEAYGIRVISYDCLAPALRPRKVIVPGRDGAYDFKAKNYDERTVQLDCDTVIGLTRDQVRELAYVLSKKNTLRIWDEPDKYYIGRVYDAASIVPIGSIGQEFTLNFICDPFAYGKVTTLNIEGGNPAQLSYAGTARTPTRIAITNNGAADAVDILIRLREKRSVY